MEKLYVWGMPGVGKSFWGKKLADHLSYQFLDLDEEIEKVSGQNIPSLFKKGEEVFRQWEAEVLRKTIFCRKVVVACGGGTPCFYGNEKWINRNGISLWLKAKEAKLIARIGENTQNRPLFMGLNQAEIAAKLIELGAERGEYYSKSTISSEINQQNINGLIAEIELLMGS